MTKCMPRSRPPRGRQTADKLALTWDDRISFVLGEKMEVKAPRLPRRLLKEEAEKNAEHADEQFDADFALMTGELTRFLPVLIKPLAEKVEAVASPAQPGGGARRPGRHETGEPCPAAAASATPPVAGRCVTGSNNRQRRGTDALALLVPYVLKLADYLLATWAPFNAGRANSTWRLTTASGWAWTWKAARGTGRRPGDGPNSSPATASPGVVIACTN